LAKLEAKVGWHLFSDTVCILKLFQVNFVKSVVEPWCCVCYVGWWLSASNKDMGSDRWYRHQAWQPKIHLLWQKWFGVIFRLLLLFQHIEC